MSVLAAPVYLGYVFTEQHPLHICILLTDYMYPLQVVDGNRLMNTPYDLSFRADRDHVSLCSRQLTQSEIQKFRKVKCSKGTASL